jgi:4-amino-4-deoxy-L-arabinose transferase-like glycosyltransferase
LKPGITRRATIAVFALTLAAYAALAFGYATLTPIWQNPDEPAHYNYVAFVAMTGGLPALQPGDWDLALLERLQNGRLEPGDDVGSIRYESWQPPLFYLAAAPVFRFGPLDDPAAMVLRLRLFNVGLGALTLGVALLVGRELMPPALAVAVPLAVAGVPMFTSIAASISADPLANLLAAATLLVLVRQVRRPARSTGWAGAAGVLIGAGLLTKLAVGIFVPLALAVVWLRSTRRVRDTLAVLGVSGLLVLPWLVHQVTAYGWTDPLATSRHASVVLDQQRFPGLSPGYLGDFFTITFHSFWAQFGWMSIVAPDRLYWLYGLVVVVAVAGLIRDRRRLREPRWLFVLATLGAAWLGYVGYNLQFEQLQGRYLFTALVPIAALLVVGWAAWMPHRLRPLGVGLVGLGLIVVNAYALIRVLVLGFAPPG